MDKLIAGFSNQLMKALDIAHNYQFKLAKNTHIDNVLIIGLGGSGIGGTIVQNYVFDKINVPVIVSKAYTLPRFTHKNTLVITCSYSGNTEETIYSLKDAIHLGCPIVTITSGGKIGDLSEEHGLDCIRIPAGFPPRSCLGYSMTQILNTLAHFELISNAFETEIQAAISLLDNEEEAIKAEALRIAQTIAHKMPVIYIENNMEGVAIRWRQQFNENGKMLAWHHVIPEMNHNELVGWRDIDTNKAVFFLRTQMDHERSKLRMELNKETIAQYTPHILEIYSKGNSYLENAFYLIYLGDWISWYLAIERNFDATEVKVIDALKSSLNEK